MEDEWTLQEAQRKMAEQAGEAMGKAAIEWQAVRFNDEERRRWALQLAHDMARHSAESDDRRQALLERLAIRFTNFAVMGEFSGGTVL